MGCVATKVGEEIHVRCRAEAEGGLRGDAFFVVRAGDEDYDWAAELLAAQNTRRDAATEA